jgi:hypothetical protein
MRDHVLLVTLTVALAVVVGGCGPSDDGSSAARQAAAPPVATPAPDGGTPLPRAVGDLRIASLEIGRSVNPDQTMHDATVLFIPTDDVWASVVVEGNAPQATLLGRWMTDGGEVLDQSSQEIKPTSRTVTSFRIAARPGGWPLGRYRFELLLNGVGVGRQDFEIRQPPL